MNMYEMARRHMNCCVRIQDCYGRCYEGVIVGVDQNNVYLRPTGRASISAKSKKSAKSEKAYTSQWFFGGGLLTLSLFTLLAIALI